MSLKRKKRGNIRYFFRSILIITVLFSITWFAPRFLKKIKWFNIKKIEIVNNKYLTTEFLMKRVNDFKGKNFFDVSVADIEIRFENIIRLKKAIIKKKFPSTLCIDISERNANLMVKANNGNLLAVDETGLILDSTDFFVDEDVPIYDMNLDFNLYGYGEHIKNKNLDKILKYCSLISLNDVEFLKNVSEFYIENKLIYIIEASVGAKIVLGDESIKASINRFKFFKENTGISKNVVYDFRYKDFLFARAEEK